MLAVPGYFVVDQAGPRDRRLWEHLVAGVSLGRSGGRFAWDSDCRRSCLDRRQDRPVASVRLR